MNRQGRPAGGHMRTVARGLAYIKTNSDFGVHGQIYMGSNKQLAAGLGCSVALAQKIVTTLKVQGVVDVKVVRYRLGSTQWSVDRYIQVKGE